MSKNIDINVEHITRVEGHGKVTILLDEQGRAGEIGILMATGFSASRVRRLLLCEGATVAGAGGLVGVAAGVGYAWLMLEGLRRPSWWLAAIHRVSTASVS